jgi:hypothetical protein
MGKFPRRRTADASSPKIRFGGFGSLDVMVDGKIVFSKEQAGRTPIAAEIVRIIKPG